MNWKNTVYLQLLYRTSQIFSKKIEEKKEKLKAEWLVSTLRIENATLQIQNRNDYYTRATFYNCLFENAMYLKS